MSEPVSRRSPPARPGGHQFTDWLTERAALEIALDTTPESDPAAREALLDRAIELERLILNTPAGWPAAIRAKTYIVRRLMEMTQADELPAMREIETFVDAFTLGATP